MAPAAGTRAAAVRGRSSSPPLAQARRGCVSAPLRGALEALRPCISLAAKPTLLSRPTPRPELAAIGRAGGRLPAEDRWVRQAPGADRSAGAGWNHAGGALRRGAPVRAREPRPDQNRRGDDRERDRDEQRR